MVAAGISGGCGQLVEDMHTHDTSAGAVADQVVRGALRFRNFIQREKPADKVIAGLPRFRTLCELTSFDQSTEAYLEKLQKEFPTVRPVELLAALFASRRRPSWLDAFWLGDVAAWISRKSAANGTVRVILEANRSAYAWLTHMCFLKVGGLNGGMAQAQWPQMCFVDPVLSTDGKQPMQLGVAREAIFLHHKESGLRARLEGASDQALASYRRWFMRELPSTADPTMLRKELMGRVQTLRAKFEEDFLTPKPRAAEAAIVRPAKARIGLCLSGGGFRATFFHLGVVRLLQDAGLLREVAAVYSVSGGSILAANLAKCWQKYVQPYQDQASFMRTTQPLRRLAQSDIRGRIIRRWFVRGWFSGWATRRLEHYYKTLAEIRFELQELPQTPQFAFLATSMRTGKAVAFLREGFHDGSKLLSCPDMPVARAVAASSAFPPVFPPVPMGSKDFLRSSQSPFVDELITDGGVYDNLGLTKLSSDAAARSDEQWCTIMLVSDASAPFGTSASDRFRTMINRGVRTTDILMKRVSDLEANAHARRGADEESDARPLILRVKIDTILEPDSIPTHPTFKVQDKRVQELTAGIRTDLDRFSDEEIASLMRHGYEVACDALIKANLVPEWFQPQDPWGVPFPRLDGFNGTERRADSDAGEQQQTEHLRKVLRNSANRRLRLFNPRDAGCWVVLLLLMTVAAYVFLKLVRTP